MGLLIILATFAAFMLGIVGWMAEEGRRRAFNARVIALDTATRGDPDAKSAIADAEAFHAFLTE